MRVLVCGGRKYRNWNKVDWTLSEWYNTQGTEATLIHGGSQGADTLAGRWALQHSVPVEVYKPDWDTHGRIAGPIRNQQMLDTGIDLVIAFPGGRGTEHMKKIARKAGVPVIEA